MLDVRNVIFQTNKHMHIFVIVAFVRAKMLFAIRTFGNNVDNQIAC